MSAYLRLLGMPTEEELVQRDRRRAWWLRVARRGMNQNGVAEAIGLSKKSGSTIGDWERGVSQPSLRQLEQLAALYGVPLDLFVNPPKTDDERLDEIVRLAGDAERRDWASGRDRGQEADDEPPAAPGRLSA
jgi:transcriptional regulator with XRE-family HTH domain